MKNNGLEEYIDTRVTEYMNDDDDSLDSLFKISLIYELSRIADALEDVISIRGVIDTYEQNC